MDLDYVLINYCSPTLAGLKQASLLCLPHLMIAALMMV